MFEKYLITGATGFLGRTVLAQLRDSKAEIRALVMEGDPLARELSQNVRVITGDVCNEAALGLFFAGADEHTCVIHCAGMISVATHPGDRIYRVNVDGTRNILKFCRQCGVGKLVYVSSVHAIPEKPKGTEIAETTAFSPELVRGDYAKSKAMATALVLQTGMQVDQHKCVHCGRCEKACKMDVDVTKAPDHPECIRCGMCVKACPTGAVSFRCGLSRGAGANQSKNPAGENAAEPTIQK